MKTEKSKTNEVYKSVFNLSQRLDFTSSSKFVALQNLYIYYPLKNIRKQSQNNKFK